MMSESSYPIIMSVIWVALIILAFFIPYPLNVIQAATGGVFLGWRLTRLFNLH